MVPDLHLLVELNSWASPEDAPEGLFKLETYLAAHRNITLTLVTRDPIRSALKQMARFGAADVPDHLIVDGGLGVYHAQGNGSWSEDHEYRRWVRTRWDPLALERILEASEARRFRPVRGEFSRQRAVFKVDPSHYLHQAVAELEACVRRCPFAAKVVRDGALLEVVPQDVNLGSAATFLQQGRLAPASMMVCAGAGHDLGLLRLADHPVLLADCLLDGNTLGIAEEKLQFSFDRGPIGILDSLFRIEFDDDYAEAVS